MKNMNNIAIALAGVCQNASLVSSLANQGYCSQREYEIGIKSIFNTSPASTIDVYGDLNDIKTGLNLLVEILSSNNKTNIEAMRYSFRCLAIAAKLRKKSDILDKISERLTRISAFYPNLSTELAEKNLNEISYSLAGIYSDLVSPMTKKFG